MTRPNPNTRILHPITARKLTVSLVAALVLLLFAATTNAQNNTNATDGSTPAGLAPGVPSGSYALSGFDNVNLYNGSMNFRLPLVSIGGRGGAGYTMMLPIEQHWTVDNYYDPFTAPSVVNTPTANSWDVIKPGYYPGVMQKRQVGFMTFSCSGETDKKWRQTVTRLTFTANDGTEYELVDQLTGGAVHFTASACTTSPFSRGKVFISHDGSSATFLSDTDVLDPLWAGEEMGMTSSDAWADNYVSGYLFLRDGTRYRISDGLVTEMRDRNGNKLTFGWDANFDLIVTDSLNRQVTVKYNYQDVAPYGLCDRITFKGFNGATRIIRVSKTGDKPSAVWLPNDDGLNRHYQFYYNGYEELRRVELPTGGAIEYDWDQGLTYSPPAEFVGMFPGADSPTFEQQIYRRVVEKRVYPDGVTLESRTTFSRPETCSDSSCSSIPNLGYVDVEQRKADGSLLGRQRHFFNGVGAANSMIAFHIMPPIVDDMEGRETQTEAYDSNGTTLLRRVINTWTPASVLGQGPTLTEVSTTLFDTNQVSKQTFSYDIYGNRTDAYEYDFGSGTAGALIRRTHTDFLTINPINGADYACDRSTTCGPNANIANVIHIRSLPAQTSIYDGGGVERSRTTFEYDNYTPDSNHSALKDWYTVTGVPISGLDSAFTTSYTKRGNATAMTRYLLVNGSVTGSISAYGQFDIAGNAVKVIDGRGYATWFYFTDCFGSPDGNARLNSSPIELSSAGQASYAFATSVTNALNQTAYAQFDYYLGRPVDGEDLNGVVASGYYNDLLDRPTQVRRAVGTSAQSQTTFSYDDLNRIVTTTSDLSANNDNVLVSKFLYDKLGRTIETRHYEGGANYVAVQAQYDSLGRAYKNSNPFRPWQSETPVWNTLSYDALGRTLTATTPDNAVVSSSYSGNTVTATDQAGKQRKSVTDALGRLTSIYEDPNGLNYQTNYAYDVLNSLTSVIQGVQTRTFVYDSLKRLTNSTNPESGTNSYIYDNNGNVVTRTDARGVVTTIAYDALNRPTTKSYSDSTPNVAYFYDNQNLPGGAPSFDRGYSTGALVAVTYGGGSAGTYRGYDVLGRVVRQYQQTDSVNYLVEAAYSVGTVLNETYPSVPGASDRRTVSYSYDTAGRLASLSSNATTYAPAASVSSIGYASHNEVKTETYGNSLVHAITYNNRLQPNEVKLGTSGNPTSILSIAYNYGATNNNGNVQGVTYNGGGLNYTQSFGYDVMNRLATSNENGGTSWSQTNGYDRYGNRWIDLGGGNQSLYFNTGNNRITNGGFTYDSAGNLTNDTIHAYTYDGENKIRTVDSITAYAYDGEGHRVKKLVGENTRFIYGIGGQLVAEFEGATGNLKKEYIYGGATLITIEPTAVNSNGTQYTTTDNVGSPRVITKSGGLVASRHDYMPFGTELGAGVGGRTTGMGFSNSGDTNRKKFTAYQKDTETGLDYAQARYYAGTQGRFTSPDPLLSSGNTADPQSWNRYTYCLNTPLTLTDPSGMEAPRGGPDNQWMAWQKDPFGIEVYHGTITNGMNDNPTTDWWSQLNKQQQILLAAKFTNVKDPNNPTQKELAAASKVFNDKVNVRLTYQNRDYGPDRGLSLARFLTVQNFVRELGNDPAVWNQIKSIDSIGVSQLEITVNAGFIQALQGTQRFSYFLKEPYTGHENSFRQLGRNISDPSMHLVTDGHSPGGFGVHWDPSSTFTENSWSEAIKDVFFAERRIYAALRHEFEPHPAPSVVGDYLRERGK